MKDRKKIIEEFSDLLNEEISNTVEQDISYERLAWAERILILQSAPVHIIAELIKNIIAHNQKVQFVVIGRETCLKLREEFGIKIVEIISHNKVFGDDDIELVKKAAEKYAVEAVIFCNNFVNSVDFSNVEHITSFLDKKIPIFSYSYVQKELNLHKNVSSHIYGCIAYKALVEWFQAADNGGAEV